MEKFDRKDKIPTRPPVEEVDQSKRNVVLGIPGVMLATAGGVLAGASAGRIIEKNSNAIKDREALVDYERRMRLIISGFDPNGLEIRRAYKSVTERLARELAEKELLETLSEEPERSKENVALLEEEIDCGEEKRVRLSVIAQLLQEQLDKSEHPILPGDGESVET